jgi:hypothetical protein
MPWMALPSVRERHWMWVLLLFSKFVQRVMSAYGHSGRAGQRASPQLSGAKLTLVGTPVRKIECWRIVT